MPVMSSTLLPLLAAAAVLIPSTPPARNPSGPVQASAAASTTIVRAARIDWFAPPFALAVRRDEHGEIRHDLEFQ